MKPMWIYSNLGPSQERNEGWECTHLWMLAQNHPVLMWGMGVISAMGTRLMSIRGTTACSLSRASLIAAPTDLGLCSS